MITRFVYPTISRYLQERGLMDKARQLCITSTTDDGKCWFGIRDAIENYCEEYGITVDSVCWMIQVKPDDYEYTKIIAKNIDDWERQFNDLNVEYKIE